MPSFFHRVEAWKRQKPRRKEGELRQGRERTTVGHGRIRGTLIKNKIKSRGKGKRGRVRDRAKVKAGIIRQRKRNSE